MKKVKFITCIFSNLYGTKWGGRPNRWGHYKWSLLSLLKMTDADFVCYTSAEEYGELYKFYYERHNISKDKFQIKVWNLEDTRYLEQIHSIKDFESAKRGDRCIEVQYTKFYWWELEDNSYDYYFWIDAGLSHTGLIPNNYLTSTHPEQRYYESSLFDNTFLNNMIEMIGDKFILLGKENDRNFWSGTVDQKFYTKYDRSIHIIGGLFGGKKELWPSVFGEFDRYLKMFLYDEKEIHHEELIMSLMFRNHPEYFTMFQFDTWWHPESAPKGLKPTYFEENKSFYKILEDIHNNEKNNSI